MTGDAQVIQGNALNLPIEDESVDLIITSPPYFALRSYRDEGEHYAGQIGSEPTPKEFLEALWAATREMVRVLKPTGSIWVNLGDKYAGSGGHNNSGLNTEKYRSSYSSPTGWDETRNAPKRYNQNADGIRTKSLMGLPWRYAIGCIDDLGLILRAEVIWNKPNGLPESVTDRVRRSHEQWFHLTKEPRYFAAVDEVREEQKYLDHGQIGKITQSRRADQTDGTFGLRMTRHLHPLGKLPGSVWTIPSEPLIVPEWARTKYNLPDHFAAFPQEWPRRIILGWSPSGVCVECGEGRRPVAERRRTVNRKGRQWNVGEGGPEETTSKLGWESETTITGYACACTPYTDHPGGKQRDKYPIAFRTGGGYIGNAAGKQTGEQRNPVPVAGHTGPYREHHLDGWTPPETKPAVVLDPFSGTGTVAMVARALGRTGISVDLSMDYSRLAKWRIFESGHASKTRIRTNLERQGAML